eukprot:CAMPEP_0194774802 /NCGR_PEP_ID=MMETSP0323_2-20130528/58581_1 /TAXON_ID=2866 ORGANISM="Crypthecodinium cohnii, Strain Seligo" /NCGR_SAMPLE_ID=MMETSP0323_2 /ASSEMBLY_ACC=CAM_ASM_000346 /LENGTH=88 /DNA_ID=CAMNT_0039710491 /DNA_START=204 /DNA_END=470 /DNA_ORIENTATION=+
MAKLVGRACLEVPRACPWRAGRRRKVGLAQAAAAEAAHCTTAMRHFLLRWARDGQPLRPNSNTPVPVLEGTRKHTKRSRDAATNQQKL